METKNEIERLKMRIEVLEAEVFDKNGVCFEKETKENEDDCE